MDNKPWKQTVGTLITAVWIYTLAGIFGSIISAIDTIHSGFDIIGTLTGDGGGSGSFMSFWEFWDYMCTVLVVIGYILFYRSLNRFEKLQLNSSDTCGAHKVKISYILLILAAAAGLIPFAGWIIKLILIIISYVKLLSGYRSLKRSEVLPQQARFCQTVLVLCMAAGIRDYRLHTGYRSHNRGCCVHRNLLPHSLRLEECPTRRTGSHR